MSNLPMFSDVPLSQSEDTPLPLIVASRWNFPLAHLQTADGMYYAIQDWMRGLTGEIDTRYLLAKFKKSDAGKEMWISSQRLSYKSTDGKTYKRDFVTDKGLYLIAQYLRVKEERPMLDEIRRFLASAGAFADALRLEPEKIVDAIKNPDGLLDAFIEYYRKRGKDDGWIQARFSSVIARHAFTTALVEFVTDTLKLSHFAVATDDVYKGLWGRTAATLRQQLDLSKNANLRDHQPTLALSYQGIVEQVCAQKLGQRQELHWEDARDIIQLVAKIIGRQAEETSQLLQQDIATGRPLLATG